MTFLEPHKLDKLFVKKLIPIAVVSFQIFTAFFVLFIIYLIFALLDMTNYDLPNVLGAIIFQPIFGFLLCAVTIIASMIVGLPIRLTKRLYNWWTKRPYIVFFGVSFGFTLLILSLILTTATNIIIDGEQKVKPIPNITLALTGWFLVAFCLLHFYPLTIINWLRTKFLSKWFEKSSQSFV